MHTYRCQLLKITLGAYAHIPLLSYLPSLSTLIPPFPPPVLRSRALQNPAIGLRERCKLPSGPASKAYWRLLAYCTQCIVKLSIVDLVHIGLTVWILTSAANCSCQVWYFEAIERNRPNERYIPTSWHFIEQTKISKYIYLT